MQTVLYGRHCALGAKIVPFAGWEMPIHYQKGILAEHQAVRQAVGLFDVSHMGRILIKGPDAERFLDYLSTNKIADKANGTATYTVWCNETGGCVDDVIVYKQSPDQFFVIVNASNRQKDLQHLLHYQSAFQVHIEDHFEEDGILALQGPQAGPLLATFFPEVKAIKSMHFLSLPDPDQEHCLIISRTGYTGAGGFELYAPNPQIAKWWDILLEKGEAFGIEPVGLGARDTLRLEMGFALYGHEINEKIAPNESVSGWTIKWQKERFIGKTALEELEKSSHKRAEYGIKLIDPGIAREGYTVFKGGIPIGEVTSGSFSPTLHQAIALILSTAHLKEGDQVEVQIRHNRCQAQVVSIPFIKAF